MIFQQVLNEESGCLSYLVGCSRAGEAVLVDPGRDRVHEYLRLARPELSYWVYQDGLGRMRWLDRSVEPPRALAQEPDTRWTRRLLVRVLGWLPIESQL